MSHISQKRIDDDETQIRQFFGSFLKAVEVSPQVEEDVAFAF